MIHEYLLNFVVYVAIYSIIVMSFNLSFGFTGLVNLGHMAFFGLGAYASALLTLNGVPWYFALPLAGIIAGITGLLIAAITVRLKGDYFQIVTLGLVFIAVAIFRNWVNPITIFGLKINARGALGLTKIPPFFGDSFYYMMFAIAVTAACAIFFYRLVNSETGKTLQAIRDDEIAASVLGKNTYFYKVLSITISTFFVGIAGSLYAHYNFILYVDPTIFDLNFFVLILSMLVLGGLASIVGSILGVFTISVVTESLRFFTVNPEIVGAMREMIFILIILLILIYRPRGILGKVDV